jgi:hypothetical protein
MLQHADAIVCENLPITTRHLVLSLSIRRGSVSHIIRDLGYSKLRSRWVRTSLTVENKTERKANFSESLARFEAEGETLSRIFIAAETFVDHFELETKGLSIMWHHPQSPRNKKLKNIRQLVMVTLFWDCEEVILVDAMPTGETINSNAYIKTLTEL